jgi:hypothetical protein
MPLNATKKMAKVAKMANATKKVAKVAKVARKLI